MKMVFVDASAWIALYHKEDKHHKDVWLIYEQLLRDANKILISNWVAYEAISFIKSRAGYKASKVLWDILQDNELSQLINIDRKLEEESVNMFWNYQDKKWGIVDCSSILLMKKKKCSLVFGYDHHFIEASRQYRFTLL